MERVRGAIHRLAIIGLAAAAPALTGPTAAHATSFVTDQVIFAASGEGQPIRYDGGDHSNNVSVDIGETSIVFHDSAAMGLSTNLPCVLNNSTTVTCPKEIGVNASEKVLNVSVLGHGGADTLTSTGFGMVTGSAVRPVALTLSGFEGDDIITATGFSYIIGGSGNDTLTSGPGKSMGAAHFTDKVDGGDGNDTINTTTNSADVDGITCDGQYDQSFTDTLIRGSNDTEFRYFVPPMQFIGSGCDTVTIN